MPLPEWHPMPPRSGCAATPTIWRFSDFGMAPIKARRICAGSPAFSAQCIRSMWGEVYVNSLDEGEGHRVREAYGGKLRSPDSTQSQIRPDELLPLRSEPFASLNGCYIRR